jgi:hypothetical protein
MSPCRAQWGVGSGSTDLTTKPPATAIGSVIGQSPLVIPIGGTATTPVDITIECRQEIAVLFRYATRRRGVLRLSVWSTLNV